MLTEDRRLQLDGIVQKMITNKEPDSNIRFVVDDFKKKYEPVNIPEATPEKKPGLLSRFEKGIEDFGQGAMDLTVNQLPSIGGIVGGIGGGIVGAGAGGIGAIPGAIAGATGGGALGEGLKQTIGKATGQRESFSPTAIATQGIEQGAFEAIGGPIIKVAGKLIGGAGKAIYNTAIPTSIKEAGLLQSYKASKSLVERIPEILGLSASKAPRIASTTALDKGLAGTESMLGVQAKRASNTLWTTIVKPRLESSVVKHDMPSFFKELKTAIVKENPELSRQKSLLEGLQSLADDYKGIKNVSSTELQKFKEGWAKFVPEKAYRGKPIAGVFNEVKDKAADLARERLYQVVGPEGRQAYFDYGNLKGLEELGQKAMTQAKLKGGSGTFISAIKDMVLTPIATVGGQTVYRTGKGIEFIGKTGLQRLGQLLLSSPNLQEPDASAPLN